MTCMLNISIDDVSPHPLASIKVIERCFDILRTFPDAKFTLFVPLAYWRTVNSYTTQRPLNISDYPEFCDVLRSLSRENFEVCFHGYHHGIPKKSNNDEFHDLSYSAAFEFFSRMFAEAELAGLKDVFKPVFRPPAWRMSPEAFDAARDIGFTVLALSSKDYACLTYAGAELAWDNVVYYTSNPPFDDLLLLEKTEIVYHACEWDRNFLNKELTDELKLFLSNNRNDFAFSFIGGLIDGKI